MRVHSVTAAVLAVILCSSDASAGQSGEWIASAFRSDTSKSSASASALPDKARAKTARRKLASQDDDATAGRRPRSATRTSDNSSGDEGGDSKKRKPEAAKTAPPARPLLARGNGAWAWPVQHASWSAEHEARYEAFIRAIGESDCRTVHDCLTDPRANPDFAAAIPKDFTYYADCADLPLALRAFFAWRNGLPFSFSTRIAGHAASGNSPPGQIGHQVTDRHDIVGPGPDFRQALKSISDYVTSNHFRIPAHYRGPRLPDHYPVRLTRASIRAGTVIYDPDGHVAVVFKVSEDGRIHYVDAHPDNSLTRGVYGRDFVRTAPDLGAGFKRWRPQTLVGATTSADGTLTGGRIELAADATLADWSDEQFIALADGKSGDTGLRGTRRNRTKKGELRRPSRDRPEAQYVHEGQPVDYYDFLRLRLAPAGFRYDPIAETRSMVRHLCQGLRDRVHAVDRAITAGIDKRPQPPRLPNNIYATNGDWELYSTPSRDARLKVSFEELKDEVARFLKLAADKSPVIAYSGDDLVRDLLAIHAEETGQCPVSYRKSDGSTKELTFTEAARRLFHMSFDPHHCAERRWGATEASELASCKDDALKAAWYKGEERLRYQVVRTYGEPMGWSLAELNNADKDIGQDEAPDIDVVAVLKATAPVQTATVAD